MTIGWRLAEEAGVTLEWVEGDAEDLPFQDESFDVVRSTFGAMFAPRQQVAAAELAWVAPAAGSRGAAGHQKGSRASPFARSPATCRRRRTSPTAACVGLGGPCALPLPQYWSATRIPARTSVR